MSNFIVWLFTEHRGKCVGVLFGLLIGILFITIGFWQTLLVLLLIGVGYIIGKSWDDPEFAERIINIFKRD